MHYPVIIDWEEWDCDTERDTAVLFEQYDASWSARSRDDLVGAHIGLHAHLKHLSRPIANHLSNGLSWYDTAAEGHPKGHTGQFDFFHMNHEIQTFLMWAGSTLHYRNTMHLMNPAVIGAIYHTVRQEHEAAKLFWKDVARGYNILDEGTIAWKLALFLDQVRNRHMEWPAPIRRHFKINQHHPSAGDVFGTSIRAVARATKGLTLGDIFMPAAGYTIPQLIDGLFPLQRT